MAWIFTPYEGLSNVHFGQGRETLESIFGQPHKVKQTYTGRTRLEYGMSNPAFVFADNKLIEINMLPLLSDRLVYSDLDLFGLPENEVLRSLEKLDADVRETVGFIIFFGLGLAMTGFHDQIPEQKAITVFAHNHPWLEKKLTMRKFSFF